MDTDKKDTILVVDDENGVRQSFNMVLKDDYNVLLAESGEEAVDVFSKNPIDLVLLDIRLPDIDGLDLLLKLKDVYPNTEVIMVTAVKVIESAVKAIKSGAYEYIIKPFDVDDVLTIIHRALEKRRLVEEVAYLRHELERYHLFEKMVGKDKKMNDIFKFISTISQSDGAVLIQGESGTGKELVARAIHNRSSRKNQPFIVVNCAAIPDTLMEREIFGHVRGAFTGADQTQIGKLEIANKGTVFLDDIDTLDTNMQAKFLRIIQEKEFERLGSTKVVKVDIRFVAASNKDLDDLISKGDFREDLFYRLDVFPIKLPPLREKKGDIPMLLKHFLELQVKNTGRPLKTFSEDAVNILMEYNWPGNVRELQNLVERMFTITQGAVIELEDLSSFNPAATKQIEEMTRKEAVIELEDLSSFNPAATKQIKEMTLKEAVSKFEKQYVRDVLEMVNGNRKLAAERLGIHRNTLLAKTNEFGLNKNR